MSALAGGRSDYPGGAGDYPGMVVDTCGLGAPNPPVDSDPCHGRGSHGSSDIYNDLASGRVGPCGGSQKKTFK